MAIPGISLDDLNAKDAVEAFTQQVTIFPLTPKFCWKLEILLETLDANGTPIERIAYARPGFAVIPDRSNHTLEFRIIRWGNITGIQRKLVEPARATMQLGMLSGVGDGDGYRRIPLVFSGTALRHYWNALRDADADAVRDVLRKSQLEVASVLAAGNSPEGRFAQFDLRIPLLFTTTAVDYLLEHLDDLLA